MLSILHVNTAPVDGSSTLRNALHNHVPHALTITAYRATYTENYRPIDVSRQAVHSNSDNSTAETPCYVLQLNSLRSCPQGRSQEARMERGVGPSGEPVPAGEMLPEHALQRYCWAVGGF